MKLPNTIWMCEDEQARWFEFEEPFDMPDAVTVTKMVPEQLVRDANQRCVDYLLELHEKVKGHHNSYLYAANIMKGFQQ